MVSKYGELTIDKIKSHDQWFMNYQYRKVKNSVQIYHCISTSLSDSSQLNIVSEAHNYTIQGTMVVEMIFKLLIQKEVINTQPTVYRLR